MTIIHGFELLEDRDIPEISARGRLFRHRLTGAELLSIENQDENKVFGITLRTPPPDSSGLPHILEHGVLCGSQKYPVKEPFIELVKGSLNTFINAFTFPDKTCYPCASQNTQDFYNLIDVYVDAVFHPLIPPHVLQQEGWHYELDGLDAPLSYKGVVFNEMKGAYSDPDDLLADRARQSLYPDTVYRFDAGGDPTAIPDLTYERFKAFHEQYYHPSNARFFFYGDDDPTERLRRMQGYLADFEAIEVDSQVALQEPFDEPRWVKALYDPGEEAGKGQMVVNWLLPQTIDPELVLGLRILAHILIGTPAAPLRKALIDSGLGEDLAGAGLDWQMRQMYFSTGLKGLAVENGQLTHAGQVEQLIDDTLDKLASQGIDPDTQAASLNTIEFHLREQNTGSFPRGLSLMLAALATWLYDGSPFASLAFETPLTAIKKRLESGETYFEDLIRTHFLDNRHRSVVTLEPELGLRRLKEAAEKERLAQARAAMSGDELLSVIENTRRLKEIQETPDSPEALATIPSLNLEDLDKENKRIPLTLSEQDGCRVLYHDLFTNGILYLDLGFDLHSITAELLPLVPLYGRALLEIGTEEQDFVKLSQRIGRSTGGIRPSLYTSAIQESDQGATWLFLRGKAVTDKAHELLAILKDILSGVRLDNRERFKQIVLEAKAEAEARLAPAGHIMVNNRLRALFNQADWANEQFSGVSQLFFLRKLADRLENDWPAVLAELQALHAHLVNRNMMVCNVTLDEANWREVQPQVGAFLAALPAAAARQVTWQATTAGGFEGLVFPAQVNYVGKGGDLYKLGYQPHGSSAVINKYLGTTWLWERVRVQGGAYGGFGVFNRRSGVYTYLSYRDPNLLATIENFDGAGPFLRSLDESRLSDEELSKAIIGAIGDLDAYQLPDAKGYTSMTRYLAGESDHSHQTWREQILATTRQDFHNFGEVLDRLAANATVVVLGSKEAIEAANTEKGGNWLRINKIL